MCLGVDEEISRKRHKLAQRSNVDSLMGRFYVLSYQISLVIDSTGKDLKTHGTLHVGRGKFHESWRITVFSTCFVCLISSRV